MSNDLSILWRAGPRARSRTTWIALVIMCLLLLVGCAVPAAEKRVEIQPLPSPTPAAPQPVVFPRDEAPHDNLMEWWYYTGHLQSASGKRYGFEFVIFQAVRGQSPVGYAAHFAVTDHQRKAFSYQQRTDQSLQPQGDGRFQLAVGDWTMGGEGDDHAIHAAANGYDIDLKLYSLKPPALHGGIGWISFGPVGDSYYYSRTRMSAEGTMQDSGTTESITGTVWMDHQWGDFVSVNGGGWDWYSVQLDDDTEVMITVLRDQPGNTAATYGSYVDAAGSVTDLKATDIEIQSTGSWRSPYSGATYPSGWRLRLPGQGLDLTLEPVLPDQELNTSESTGVSYWEGDVTVSGTRYGAPISGHSYVELTGYAR